MANNSDTTRGHGLARFDRASKWFLFGLIVFSLTAIGHSWYRAALPSDGWTFPFEFDQGFQQYVFDDFVGSQDTPLQTGDILVAIEGRTVEQLVGAAIGMQSQRPANWGIGETVRYTVQRDGRIIDLEVTLMPRQLGAILIVMVKRVLLVAPGSLPQLLIGLVIFRRRPNNRGAQLLLLFVATNFVIIAIGQVVTGENMGIAELFFPLAYWPGMFFSLLAFPLVVVPTTGYLFLRFPVEKGFIKAHPRIAVFLTYTVAPLVLLIGLLNTYSQPLTFWNSVFLSGAPLLFPLFNLIAVASLVHTLITTADPLRKAQSRWLLIGLIVGQIFGNGVFFFLVELGIIPGSLTITILQAAMGLAFPISLLIVILKYKLWEIDIIINKSLVYGALTILLSLFFFGSLFVISQQFQDFSGGAGLAMLVSATVFGVIFQPTRYRLQRFVDRRFYNIQIDYQNAPKNRRALQLPATTPDTFEGLSNLKLIGEGGMAKVYKADMVGQNEPVAIKILPERLLSEGEFSQRFRREAETISKLDHPNIVNVFKYGEEGNLHYMVMEYLNGGDIAAKMKIVRVLNLTEAMPFITQIAAALDYAHTQGLVHRDIKPSNIMLHYPDGDKSQPPRAVLMDFGIAKLLNQTAITKTGGLLGTFDYIAPEQIQETGGLDKRADIYSFGVLVFQMLTGRLPFEHSTPAAALIAHITQPPPHPRDLEPDIPLATAEAILKALEKAPVDRFDSAGEFAKALASA